MLLLILGLVAGLVILTISADQFVAGAARVSVALRIAPAVIGAVVIGFGTSAPEMVVSGIAAASGSLDIAVGNILGSNIANLSLVLGSAALLAVIAVDDDTLRRQAPLSLGSVLLFALLVQGGLERWEGVVLAVTLVAALTYLLRSGKDDGVAELAELVDDDAPRPPLGREAGRTLVGLLGTLGAAQLLVSSATGIADVLGLEEGFVGLTIVAIGTSLPELATSIIGVRKGETQLIVGNLLGSNLFNSLAVGAVAAFAGPGMVRDAQLTTLGVGLMITVAVLTTVALVTNRKVVRWEGAVLLILYLATLPLLA